MLNELQVHSRLDIFELKEKMGDVRLLIETGMARLVIVQSPWGLEFLLETARGE
jgi:hypothetical protein